MTSLDRALTMAHLDAEGDTNALRRPLRSLYHGAHDGRTSHPSDPLVPLEA